MNTSGRERHLYVTLSEVCLQFVPDFVRIAIVCICATCLVIILSQMTID